MRLDDNFKGFIQAILISDPGDRPDINQVLHMIDNYEHMSFTFTGTGAQIASRQKKRGVDRDLTEEELEREMKRMREDMGKPRVNPHGSRPSPS
jgi:hypothetical protein